MLIGNITLMYIPIYIKCTFQSKIFTGSLGVGEGKLLSLFLANLFMSRHEKNPEITVK